MPAQQPWDYAKHAIPKSISTITGVTNKNESKLHKRLFHHFCLFYEAFTNFSSKLFRNHKFQTKTSPQRLTAVL